MFRRTKAAHESGNGRKGEAPASPPSQAAATSAAVTSSTSTSSGSPGRFQWCSGRGALYLGLLVIVAASMLTVFDRAFTLAWNSSEPRLSPDADAQILADLRPWERNGVKLIDLEVTKALLRAPFTSSPGKGGKRGLYPPATPLPQPLLDSAREWVTPSDGVFTVIIKDRVVYFMYDDAKLNGRGMTIPGRAKVGSLYTMLSSILAVHAIPDVQFLWNVNPTAHLRPPREEGGKVHPLVAATAEPLVGGGAGDTMDPPGGAGGVEEEEKGAPADELTTGASGGTGGADGGGSGVRTTGQPEEETGETEGETGEAERETGEAEGETILDGPSTAPSSSAASANGLAAIEEEGAEGAGEEGDGEGDGGASADEETTDGAGEAGDGSVGGGERGKAGRRLLALDPNVTRAGEADPASPIAAPSAATTAASAAAGGRRRGSSTTPGRGGAAAEEEGSPAYWAELAARAGVQVTPAPNGLAPVFSMCKRAGDLDVLSPNSYFRSAPRWNHSAQQLGRAAAKFPWLGRFASVWWRGASGDEWPAAKPRAQVISQWHGRDFTDLAFTNNWGAVWGGWVKRRSPWVVNKVVHPRGGRVPWGDTNKQPVLTATRFRYALHLPGSFRATYSRALQYLLWTGTLVMFYDAPYFEFYYRHLTPWEHFLPVNLTNLRQRWQWAQEHPAEASTIASAGLEFARQRLSGEAVAQYWVRLLREYAKLQRWDARMVPQGACGCWSLGMRPYRTPRNVVGHCPLICDPGPMEEGLKLALTGPAKSVAGLSSTAVVEEADAAYAAAVAGQPQPPGVVAGPADGAGGEGEE